MGALPWKSRTRVAPVSMAGCLRVSNLLRVDHRRPADRRIFAPDPGVIGRLAGYATPASNPERRSQPMDAIVLLKDDHKTVEKLFKEFERLHKSEGSPEAKKRIV